MKLCTEMLLSYEAVYGKWSLGGRLLMAALLNTFSWRTLNHFNLRWEGKSPDFLKELKRKASQQWPSDLLVSTVEIQNFCVCLWEGVKKNP